MISGTGLNADPSVHAILKTRSDKNEEGFIDVLPTCIKHENTPLGVQVWEHKKDHLVFWRLEGVGWTKQICIKVERSEWLDSPPSSSDQYREIW